jgi:hypothetical protein
MNPLCIHCNCGQQPYLNNLTQCYENQLCLHYCHCSLPQHVATRIRVAEVISACIVIIAVHHSDTTTCFVVVIIFVAIVAIITNDRRYEQPVSESRVSVVHTSVIAHRLVKRTLVMLYLSIVQASCHCAQVDC